MNESAVTARNPLATDEGTRPTLMLLVGWFVAHCVVWIGLVKLLPGDEGVPFADLGALGTPWVRQFIVPLGVVFTLQVVGIGRLGWWRSVARDERRTERRWLAVLPVLVLLVGVGKLAADGLSLDAGTSYLTGCAITVALVGLTEEITFRGVLLVGARRVFRAEWMAVIFSSVLFGLFHAPNIVVGAKVGPTIGQVVVTAVIGTAIYCLRRVSGWLWLCVLLHGVYDFMLIQGAWDKLF